MLTAFWFLALLAPFILAKKSPKTKSQSLLKVQKAAHQPTSPNLTIISPQNVDLNAYSLVPFNVTSNFGFPIVTVSFDCDPAFNATGNSSSLIYVRVPPYNSVTGGNCVVTASAQDYNSATASYFINIFINQIRIENSTMQTFYQNSSGQVNSSLGFDYPFYGPINYIGTYLTGSVPSGSNLTGFQSMFTTSGGNVVYYSQSSCTSVTYFRMSFDPAGSSSLTNCAIYGNGYFMPATPFYTVYGYEAYGTHTIDTYAITDNISGTVNSNQDYIMSIDLAVGGNFAALNISASTVPTGSTFEYTLVYGASSNYTGTSIVNMTTC